VIKRKEDTFKTVWSQNDQKLMNYHRFFEENFSQVKDLDVKTLESKLHYPRDEILGSFIVYISLCKLLAAQNLKGTLPAQRRFLEQLKRGIRH
jgi:hypothetical protein